MKVNPYHTIGDPAGKLCETGTAWNVQFKNVPESEVESRAKTTTRRDRSNGVHKRLSKAEGAIQLLRSQIACEKASWDRRFLELQRKQQELREQLVSETFARAGVFLKDDVTEDGVFGGKQVQMEEENQRGLSGELLHLQQHGAENFRPVGSLGSLSGSQVSLSSSLWSRPTSALSTNSRSSRSGPMPSRAFVPHSPLDLQIGHRVRVMLPSGRISTGRLRYVGPLEDSRDFRLGVELETPHHGQNDGALEGQSYFKCEPGHGAFVTFDKLLVAWE
ncbi:hypothetical protein AGOR_G00120280 [Albula goreensis]|uniref:CAP-Gly domain-containing protein n=1 Tax=Albula goreensis TaxID=1534307 RepID=A0A8T3DFA8_9TELE|nr:hypothetical protein AGOR_G00120280 [Albula goreensis]